MKQNFLQFDIFTRNLSYDEQMVAYFGRHSTKTYIKSKPVRFRFNILCIFSTPIFKFMPHGEANRSAKRI